MGVLWDLAERTGMTCFGTSAAYIAACMKDGVEPGTGRDLSRLRSVGSTGSPLSPRASGVPTTSTSRHLAVLDERRNGPLHRVRRRGPTLPVYKGELQPDRSARRSRPSTRTATP